MPLPRLSELPTVLSTEVFCGVQSSDLHTLIFVSKDLYHLVMRSLVYSVKNNKAKQLVLTKKPQSILSPPFLKRIFELAVLRREISQVRDLIRLNPPKRYMSCLEREKQFDIQLAIKKVEESVIAYKRSKSQEIERNTQKLIDRSGVGEVIIWGEKIPDENAKGYVFLTVVKHLIHLNELEQASSVAMLIRIAAVKERALCKIIRREIDAGAIGAASEIARQIPDTTGGERDFLSYTGLKEDSASDLVLEIAQATSDIDRLIQMAKEIPESLKPHLSDHITRKLINEETVKSVQEVEKATQVILSIVGTSSSIFTQEAIVDYFARRLIQIGGSVYESRALAILRPFPNLLPLFI